MLDEEVPSSRETIKKKIFYFTKVTKTFHQGQHFQNKKTLKIELS